MDRMTHNIREPESCEICNIEFDCFDVIPKELACCKKAYCAKCLSDWKKRKEECPNCRKKILVDVESLPLCTRMFRHKCPNCEILTNLLYVKKDLLNNYVFCCLYCVDGMDAEKEKDNEFHNFFDTIFEKNKELTVDNQNNSNAVDSLKMKLTLEFEKILSDFCDNAMNKFQEKLENYFDKQVKNDGIINKAVSKVNTLKGIQSLLYKNHNNQYYYNYTDLRNLLNQFSENTKINLKETGNSLDLNEDIYRLSLHQEIVTKYFLGNLRIYNRAGDFDNPWKENLKKRNIANKNGQNVFRGNVKPIMHEEISMGNILRHPNDVNNKSKPKFSRNFNMNNKTMYQKIDHKPIDGRENFEKNLGISELNRSNILINNQHLINQGINFSNDQELNENNLNDLNNLSLNSNNHSVNSYLKVINKDNNAKKNLPIKNEGVFDININNDNEEDDIQISDFLYNPNKQSNRNLNQNKNNNIHPPSFKRVKEKLPNDDDYF